MLRRLQSPPLFRPGTKFSYANTNYIALGLIIEKVTGQHLDQVLGNRIFRPFGLEDTTYGVVALQPDDRIALASSDPAYSTIALASRDGSKIVVVAKPVFAFESVLAMAEELYCS